MNRRSWGTLCGGLILSVVIAVSTTGLANSADTVDASVGVDTSGKIIGGINSHYIGLSFEASALASGKFDAVGNLPQLLRNLGSSTLRFGGNSVDQTSYAGANQTTLAGLSRLANASGWSVLLSENLGHFNAMSVTADASSASSTLGSQLVGIACGNEPDLYAQNGVRPTSYTESEYLAEVPACLSAIQAGAPNTTLFGPDADGTRWLASYASQENGTIGWLDQHYYALSCAEQSGHTPAELAAMLLSSSQNAEEVNMFTSTAAAAQTAGVHVRISETNSASCGGATGVSNAYAAALWVIDYLLTGAEHGGVYGVYAMNLHGRLDAACAGYTPLCQTGTNQYTPQPIYYGMLFTHLLGIGHMLPVTVNTSGRVAAHALRTLDNSTIKVIVENLGPSTTTTTLAVANASALDTLRLTGPVDPTGSGPVAIQGATVAGDGTFTPGSPDHVVCAHTGQCTLSIPPYTAVLAVVDQ
jgi:hypothetical protein